MYFFQGILFPLMRACNQQDIDGWKASRRINEKSSCEQLSLRGLA